MEMFQPQAKGGRGSSRAPFGWAGGKTNPVNPMDPPGERRPERGETQPFAAQPGQGTPFGTPSWQVKAAKSLGLVYSLRPRGRPRKDK